MEFKQLRSYVEVVRCKSFTGASKNLFISQPTVSLHINQLEAELGVHLIVRTTKSIEVTELGQRLYDYAVDLLAMRDRMIANCSLRSRRILSLGASTIPSAYVLPGVLSEFGRQYPETYFVIHQSDSLGVMRGLLDGTYDLGLTGMKPETDSLTCEEFLKDRIILIAPVNDHYLSLKESGSDISSIILSEPVILREAGSGSEKKAEEILRLLQIPEERLRVAARINDQEAIKNMVAGGLGISLISELAARQYIDEKRLVAFHLPDAFSARSLYIVYRTGYILHDDLQAFIKFLRAHAGTSGAL